ncbi:MAG: J domain-containing protein [Sphingomonadales bacterium]
MKRARKSWGFPKWGAYGADRDAVRVRICDFDSCDEKADHPAPKSPLADDKWWFCERHAAEYNKNWNFFEGMTTEEAKAYARDEGHTAAGYGSSGVYGWGGVADADGLTPVERKAFEALGLEPDASGAEIKASYRNLAKKYHPDTGEESEKSSRRFQAVLTAYQVLKPRFNDGKG